VSGKQKEICELGDCSLVLQNEGGAEDGTQSLTHARQTFCHWATSPTFFFFLFKERLLKIISICTNVLCLKDVALSEVFYYNLCCPEKINKKGILGKNIVCL
jgi:hypothetical protein